MTAGLAERLLTQAVTFHRAGQLDQAEKLYREILAANPRYADALQFLGLIALTRGDAAAAAARIREAIAINPRAAVYHFNLGMTLKQSGDLDGMIEAYRRAVKLNPDLVEAHNNLGNALRAVGDAQGGVASLRRALALRPDNAEALLNLSAALLDLGQASEAEQAVRRALALKPDLAEAHFNLGNTLLKLGRSAEAVDACRRALELRPQHAQTLLTLGNALQGVGRFAEAIAAFESARTVEPQSVEIHNNIGNAWFSLGERKQAIEWYRKALALKPDYGLVINNLGVALQQEGRIDEAITAYRAARENGAEIDASNNLGLALPVLGEFDQAIAEFRRAIAARPDYVAAYRNMLGVMLYAPDLDNEALWAAHCEFGAAMAARATTKLPAWEGSRDPERRLRIGYVSSDFYDHPVGRNLEPVLAGRDRARFDVVGYAEQGAPDGMTARLRGLTDEWRVTLGLSDEALARQIRADRIDILVLLAGRFDKNRPQAACWRAAPVQVSFHDPATSGIAEMDYLIADPVLAPKKDRRERFTERVARLPSFYIHAPLENAPDPGPPPLASGAPATFGSFNNPAKLNRAVLKLWGEVLTAIPGSRLALKFKNWFGNENLRERVLNGLGVDAERVMFVAGDTERDQHLALYRQIDVALDPFPFTGSTTSFEALSMGVPVVTLAGDRMVARWTAAMLTRLGLTELIAEDPAGYVRIARELAGDARRLSALRAGLPARVAASPLCAAYAKARQVERLYRAFWRRFCARRD